MKYLFACLFFVLASFSVYADTMAPDTSIQTNMPVIPVPGAESWEVFFTKNLNGCGVGTVYSENTLFSIGINRKADKGVPYYLVLANKKWSNRIEPAQHYKWSISLDGDLYDADMIGTTNSSLIASFDDDFLKKITDGHTIIFYDSSSHNRQIANLSLKGTAIAVNALNGCQQAWDEQSAKKPAKDQKPPTSVSYGTGFYVAPGYAVTANHVVSDCKAKIQVWYGDNAYPATLVSSDDSNDLAILKSEFQTPEVLPLSSLLTLGSNNYTFGYPLPGTLSDSGVFTNGSLSATSGLSNDWRFLQTSTPVQQGNSGGALVDQFGSVIGIVDEKLDAVSEAKNSGDIPQNVNFAVKSSLLSLLLTETGVSFSTKQGPELRPEEIASKMQKATVKVVCQ